MLKWIKNFFEAILLMFGNPLKKLAPEADKILQEFKDSEVGKTALADLKAGDVKGLEKILILLKNKVQVLVKDNERLTRIVLAYLKDKILSLVK
jgi:Skp family chaperone for outer membrane proteins